MSPRARDLSHFILLYAAIYGAFGTASPFWPRFFETRGLTAEEIGLLFGVGTIVRLIVGPVAGRGADLRRALRLFLGICAFLSAGAALGLLLVNGFWPLSLIQLCESAALAPIPILADALAVTAARRENFEYGWVRGSASAAFVICLLSAGQIVGSAGFSLMVWIYAALLAGAGCAAAFVPPVEPEASIRRGQSWMALAGLRELLAEPRFRRVLVVAALIYGSHAMNDTFAIIRWSSAGISSAGASILWSESVAAEVVVFFVIGPKLVNWLNVGGATALSAAAGVVRWIVMAESTDIAALALIQPLHGLTFALTHLACMRLIGAVVPPRLAATAQGLYLFGPGAATALMTIASGELYALFGARGFLFMALLCAAALPVSLGLRAQASPSR
ncbi:MAG TPA: MFS transporter [Xanthobacteraceae bacterium]|jgi:PPP family 3-phenylpropionic acid transporter